MTRLVKGRMGMFTAADLTQSLRPEDSHFPKTKLVCLENTHNRGGGRILPLSTVEEIAQVCREHDLRLHLDGARLWNACAATGISAARYAAPFDTVSVCFSKGLGAPVGSALVGSKAHVQRARRFRKLFGGGMRQAGMMAAGALYALRHHRDRLQDDHINAKLLAAGLAQIEGIDIHPDDVQTNIVVFYTRTMSAQTLVQQLEERGVAVLAVGPNAIRAVTHLMISREQIQQVPARVADVLRSHPATVN